MRLGRAAGIGMLGSLPHGAVCPCAAFCCEQWHGGGWLEQGRGEGSDYDGGEGDDDDGDDHDEAVRVGEGSSGNRGSVAEASDGLVWWSASMTSIVGQDMCIYS